MITFVEKTPREEGAYPWGQKTRTLVPVYMVKNGHEYFVMNHHEGYNTRVLKLAERDLIQTDGAFCRITPGEYSDPMALLSVIESNGMAFEDADVFTKTPMSKCGFMDFTGVASQPTGNESIRFWFRIYDPATAKQVKKMANAILKRTKRQLRTA